MWKKMSEFPELRVGSSVGNSNFSEHTGWGCNKYPVFLVKWSFNYKRFLWQIQLWGKKKAKTI